MVSHVADARALIKGFAHPQESEHGDLLIADALTIELLLLVVDDLADRVAELEERACATQTGRMIACSP